MHKSCETLNEQRQALSPITVICRKMTAVTPKRCFVSDMISIYIAHHSSSSSFHSVSFRPVLLFLEIKNLFPIFLQLHLQFLCCHKSFIAYGRIPHFSSFFFVCFSPLLLNSLSASHRFLYLVAVMITRVESPLAVTTGNLPRQRLIAAVKGKVYSSWLLAYSKFIQQVFHLGCYILCIYVCGYIFCVGRASGKKYRLMDVVRLSDAAQKIEQVEHNLQPASNFLVGNFMCTLGTRMKRVQRYVSRA